MGLGIAPLEIKILLESNHLKSRILVRRFALINFHGKMRQDVATCGSMTAIHWESTRAEFHAEYFPRMVVHAVMYFMKVQMG